MNLKQWLRENFISHQFLSESVIEISSIKYCILSCKQQSFPIGNSSKEEIRNVIFDGNFNLIFSDEELDIITRENIERVIFSFGQKWYHSSIEKTELFPLKYIGESDSVDNPPFLGVHGGYEVCNGSRDYGDWCKKAKFLGLNTLGICEYNTLAGTLIFQFECKKTGVKSIIGETVLVRPENTETIDLDYKVKLFVYNQKGWENLLLINSEIRVHNEGFVMDSFLLEHNEGLVCVIESDTTLTTALTAQYLLSFKNNLYYQLNFTEWSSSDRDKKYLASIQHYLKHFHKILPPLLISDAYYLDREDARIKKILNQIGRVGFQFQSKSQHFKCIEEIVMETEKLFQNTDLCDNLLNESIVNLINVCDGCNFSIPINELHLPQYPMKTEEAEQFESNEELFWSLIDKGLQEKIIGVVEEEKEEVYIQRVEREAELISKGNLIDYFLITWDILNWCRENNILTGIGRGSSAGSLICYLLGIVKVDPLQYDLLFERFINESRIISGLPDIDNDVQSDRRDDVKRYIESRYGEENVVSIGTYGNFKMRAVVKDLSKEFGVDIGTANYISAMIDPECSFQELFESSANTAPLKQHIQQHSSIFDTIPLILNQPKTESMHAAGVLITPKIYKDQERKIFTWMPVKKVDGVLVSEWEGPELEKAGFLKEDILGIKQLEKFAKVFELIEKNHSIKVDFNTFDVSVEGVYDLFKQGYTEDVFQFGAQGLKNYCLELKPESINDLIATVALYRPGPIGSGAHKDYIKIKNGAKLPVYDFMLENVTKNTHSMYIYQEQIMQAMQILGGFTLTEADDIRSAMGKKNIEKMEKYKGQFLTSAIEKGCDQYKAIQVWNKLSVFAEYGFNKSHATVYAYTGYFCQWLKYMYPIEFWTISMYYAKDEEIGRRINEMHRISPVQIIPPDINISHVEFQSDFKSNKIYWSLSSIKFAGDSAVTAIIEERDKNGQFFSFKEFLSRIPKKSVNKRVVTNLILSGCFDQIENIKSAKDRYTLIQTYFKNHLTEPVPEEFTNSQLNWKDYFWVLKQKELTGFGHINYHPIFKSLDFSSKITYVDETHFELDACRGHKKCVGGIVTEILERNSKKGFFATIFLNCNDQMITALVWSEIWQTLKPDLTLTKGKILFITGEVKFDEFRKQNILQTNLDTELRIL